MKKPFLIFFALLLFYAVYSQQQPVSLSPSDALYLKGLSYSTTGMMLKDVSKARAYFHQAAALGNSKAMVSLGTLNAEEKDYLSYDSAFYWYNEAMKKGNTDAWLRLGNLYHFAQAGVEQDFSKAYLYYKQGAAAGDAQCLAMQGYYYFKGLTGQQNYALADAYFTKAIAKGNRMATYYQGLEYRNGYGVERNADKAKELLTAAANMGEKQARKELKIAEPENPLTPLLAPVSIQQNNNAAYRRIRHNLSQGSVTGTYKGYAIRYDWSGQNIISIFPLEVTFNSLGDKINGTWKEGKDVTGISAVFTDSALLFTNTQYNKIDHYSEFKGGEVWKFNNAKFNLLQQPDSTFITGNIQLYSDSRKEPGKPLYIHLARATNLSEQALLSKELTTISCNNPFDNTLSVTFTIPVTSPVIIQLVTSQGQVIHTENAGTLQAGTYRRNIPVLRAAAGSYILELQTKAGKQVKTIVKQ